MKVIKNYWFVILFGFLALLFAATSAANIEGGYSPNDNETVVFLSYTAGSFISYSLILVVPAFLLKWKVLTKNTWVRWVISILIMFIMFSLATVVLVS